MKKKFGPAFQGLLDGFKHPAILTQWVLGALTIMAGIFIKLEYGEWLIVIVAIGIVITSEMLNTCIEKLCDLYTEENDERIKKIKDLSAGAVLVASITALAIACLILIRHI